MRRSSLAFIAAVVLAAALGLWLMLGRSAEAPPKAAPPPMVPVTAAPAEKHDVPIYLQGLGNVQAFNQVLVRPQVDGQLKAVLFKEGQEVHAGDILAEIDPRSYQAQLDQAVAKKAQDEATLANDQLDVARYAKLVEGQYIARQQLDTARAAVAQLVAAVQGDQAAIENAQVQLGYTTIRSPIEGRAGIRQIDPGNIVHAADATGIVVITQVHPISVLFTLPEDAVGSIVAAMANGPLKAVALSRDGKKQLDEGQLALIDNQIDLTTGTVRLKATLPNKNRLLWPGQFVNVRLLVETRPGALTVPITAILRGQQGAYAYVIKEDGSVENRAIDLGPISEGVAIVNGGVSEGEQVVTGGQYRLQPGTKVQVKATMAGAEQGKTP